MSAAGDLLTQRRGLIQEKREAQMMRIDQRANLGRRGVGGQAERPIHLIKEWHKQALGLHWREDVHAMKRRWS